MQPEAGNMKLCDTQAGKKNEFEGPGDDAKFHDLILFG